MADVRFTPAQQQAIDTTDRSILVSAAAGSGKTAVLIERIISIILDGKADVDEILVVTFTNAAASEMRLKLTRALRKRIKEHPEDAPKLKEQLGRLYRSYISTFNSFAIRIIKEFFYEIDIEPVFQVCDEVKSQLLMSGAVDTLFEEGFARDDFIECGSFRAFLRRYSSDRSEAALKSEIISAYGKLRSMPDYFEWAEESARVLSYSKEEFLASRQGRLMLSYLENRIEEACEYELRIRQLLEAAGLEDFYTKSTDKVQSLEQEYAQLLEVRQALRDGRNAEEVIRLAGLIKFDRMPTPSKEQKPAYAEFKEEISELRSEVKKLIGSWLSSYCQPDLDSRIAEMNETYGYTMYFIELLKRFEALYEAGKKESGLMDFADMEHNAARILKNPDIADILRKRFKYIFIDEYQDTNNLQEHLIGCFAREDNVFKVGDVKQSIYKFRQAEPAIFEKTRADYSSPDNESAISIDLNQNFRSNSRTIEYINYIFEQVMEGYDEAASLKPGLDFGEELDRFNFIPEVHILTDDSSSDSEAGGEETSASESDGWEDEIINLSAEEAEAAHVASVIKGIIGTEFYDSKAGVVRRATAGDITILLRSTKIKGSVFSKALRKVSVDSMIEEDSDYFDTIEVKVATSLLQAIDNPMKDIPLISALHSEVYDLSARELGLIRAAFRRHCLEEAVKGPTRFYDAAIYYRAHGDDEALRLKLDKAMTSLEYYGSISGAMPLEQFIWKVLVETDYYLYAGAIYNGERRQANLRALVDRAAAYAGDNIATLGDFLSYLEVLQTKKISLGQMGTGGSEEELVQITTIHKSKGLEYPFVIVAGLGSRLHRSSSGKGFSFDSMLGVGLSYVNTEYGYWRSTILQRLILDHLIEDEYKEELRVLYVALTRARNKLYLVGTVKPDFESSSSIHKKTSFFEIIKDRLSSPYNKTLHLISERESRQEYGSDVSRILASIKKLPGDKVAEELKEVERRLDFEYPDKYMLTHKSKFSVSELRRASLEAASSGDSASSEDDAAASAARTEEAAEHAPSEDELYNLWKAAEYRKTKASKADIGTAYHRVMEMVDFARAIDDEGFVNTSYIGSLAAELLAGGAISPEVFSMLNLDRISAFFASPLGRRAAKAASKGLLMKEKPFTLKTQHEGKSVLVQGVIDCCFEEDGRMILIDYKSSYIRRSVPLEDELRRLEDEYRIQLELYAKALSEGTGLDVSETYLYLFTLDRELRIIC